MVMPNPDILADVTDDGTPGTGMSIFNRACVYQNVT